MTLRLRLAGLAVLILSAAIIVIVGMLFGHSMLVRIALAVAALPAMLFIEKVLCS